MIFSFDHHLNPIFKRYREIITERRIKITIVFMWFGAYGIFVLPVLITPGFYYYIYSPTEIVCGDFWQYAWFGIFAVMAVPIVTSIGLFYCTYRIIHHLRTQKVQAMVGSKAFTRSSKRNIKAIKLLVITAMAYFAAWLPYVLQLFIILIPKNPPYIHPVLKFLLLWTGMSNSFTNVLIYLSVYTAFRHNSILLMHRITCKLCFRKIIKKSKITNSSNTT